MIWIVGVEGVPDLKIPPLLHDRYSISVRFNGVFYPPNSVLFSALHCVAPLYVLNSGYPEYPVSGLGSLLKVCQNDRYFAIFSRHQVQSRDPREVTLETVRAGHWVTGHRLVHDIYSSEDPRSSDLCIVEFTDLVAEGKLSKSGWLQLARDYKFEEFLGCIILGYPSDENRVYECADEIRQRCIAAQDDLLSSRALGLHTVVLDQELQCDPDGLSGGAVFFLVRKDSEVWLIPGGTIISGNRMRMNFVHAREYQAYIDFSPEG